MHTLPGRYTFDQLVTFIKTSYSNEFLPSSIADYVGIHYRWNKYVNSIISEPLDVNIQTVLCIQKGCFEVTPVD